MEFWAQSCIHCSFRLSTLIKPPLFPYQNKSRWFEVVNLFSIHSAKRKTKKTTNIIINASPRVCLIFSEAINLLALGLFCFGLCRHWMRLYLFEDTRCFELKKIKCNYVGFILMLNHLKTRHFPLVLTELIFSFSLALWQNCLFGLRELCIKWRCWVLKVTPTDQSDTIYK